MINDKDAMIIVYIGVSTFFFAFISWLNVRTKNGEYKRITTLKDYIQGITNSFLGSLIGVLIYAGVSQFYPNWSDLFKGSIAVTCGSLLSEAVIQMGKRKLKDV